jgi:hypothetical protein
MPIPKVEVGVVMLLRRKSVNVFDYLHLQIEVTLPESDKNHEAALLP